MPQDLEQPILITGGTGFVGSHLVEALQAKGFTNLHVTSLSSTESGNASAHIHQVDLTNRDQVLALWQQLKPTQIYHLASIAVTGNSFDQADKIMANNTTLQLNVLEALKTVTPTARLLAVGSAEQYGLVDEAVSAGINELTPFNPVNPYAVSKITQEFLARTYAQAFKLNLVLTRAFNHTGERQAPQFAIPHFAQQIAAVEKGQQTEIKVGNLTAIRDFTDVKDVVQAYVLLMEQGQVGQVYNVGSGRGVQMQAVLDELISLAHQPIPVTQDAAQLRPLDVPRVIADNGKITALGWRAETPLSQTLQRVLDYWRAQT